MSRFPGFDRWFIVTVASVVGFLIGIASVVYLVYAWVPANVILRDAPPRFLRFDPTGERPDYRDMYVARVAGRYARLMQDGQPDAALEQAQRALGVTVGDATPIEALAMASSALQAARNENARDGDNPDQGWFTLADQNNLAQLVERLEQVKDQPPVIAQSVSEARRNAALFGGLLLLLWIGVLTGALLLVAKWLKVAPSAAVRQAANVDADVIEAQPVPVANANAGNSPAAAAPAAAPTEPGVGVVSSVSSPPYGGGAPWAAASSLYTHAPTKAPSPVPGESFVNTFVAVYQHGDEGFDEDFTINARSGEMIGECGVSIAERAGLTVPAQVVALAVWVFDKCDFLSTTRVVLTPYANRNDVIRNKLAQRGELVLAQPTVLQITTSTLRVEVAVRDLRMLPLGGEPNGYFERAEFEFRVYKKPPASTQ